MNSSVIKLGWEATPAQRQTADTIEAVLRHYNAMELSELSLSTIKTPIGIFRIAATISSKYVPEQ
jgi:hypothetical protein